ncbi:hypothetical protein DAI22_04g130000 [Oryza sativa Japonica Group]|nr:hypothetical protein DAI22_04g130000 [Oryza sativa Japonica Group]
MPPKSTKISDDHVHSSSSTNLASDTQIQAAGCSCSCFVITRNVVTHTPYPSWSQLWRQDIYGHQLINLMRMV